MNHKQATGTEQCLGMIVGINVISVFSETPAVTRTVNVSENNTVTSQA